ncbi:MAG: carboxypeptidase-like regulatory domain-containing protein [Marinilabiliaceae bacterium]|nr:carboxypeptidase-like regulatory domain-containing protein [Marinilabiliaceae bacterium]
MKYSNSFLLFINVLLFTNAANSQTLKGTVTSYKGETIPFSSIYIKETTFGTTTNNQGEYEIKLPDAGTYNITFQSIGFQKQEQTISINKNETKIINIILLDQIYQLKEVRVYSNNEDPAYNIMRKAIGMAPYYLRQIEHYESDVYLKGTLILDKAPKLLVNQMKKEDVKIEIGKRYTSESMNHITFDEPDKYHHKVISSRSSFPNNDENTTIGYINSSFYQPQIDMVISPLSPNSFKHYKFKFIDFFKEGNIYVNKIEIIPRRKSQQLVKGTIYIVENIWNIYSINVKLETFYGAIQIKQTYSPVQPNTWLPTSHNFNIDASVFGIKGKFNYISSVKYKNVKPNTKLPIPSNLETGISKNKELENIEQKIINSEKTKNQQRIDALLNKTNINNRDMIKLSHLMKKESLKKSNADTTLEIKPNDKYIINRQKNDTLKNDTLFWSSIRPIPLATDELESFAINDSLKIINSKTINKNKHQNHLSKTIDIFKSGKELKNKKNSFTFKYNGLFGFNNIGFNPVEAFWLKQSTNISFNIDSIHKINFTPYIKYSFGQKKIYWNTHINFNYAPLKRGSLNASFGHTNNDFYKNNSITPVVNLGYNLLLKQNFLKLYHNHYYKIQNNIDIINGLTFSTSIKHEQFYSLQNKSEFSFFNKSKKYNENTPLNNEAKNINYINQTETSVNLSIQFTPQMYYRIKNGQKQMLYSKYPTLYIRYKQGVDNITKSNSKFSLLEGFIFQKKELGTFSSLQYSIGGGYFLNNDQMHFSSFKHFNTIEPNFEIRNTENSFALLNNYSSSTNKWFQEAHIQYISPLIILKRLPLFSNRLWTEKLYGNYLSTPTFKNYYELGYGIGQIFFLGEVSVFSGFNKLEPNSCGIKVILQLQ